MSYNPFMPDLSFNRGVVFGGGGRRSSGPTAAQQAATKAAADKAAAAAKAKAAAEAAAKAKAAAEAKARADAAAKAKAEAAAAAAQAKTNADNAGKLQAQVLADPSSMVTESEVAQIDPNAAGTNIASTTGQVTGAVPQVDDPTALSAAIVTPETVTNKVKGITDATQAVQGEVSEDATVEAATMSPDDLAALDLQATQLAEAQKVAVVPPRAIQPGELLIWLRSMKP
jgi:colicin import membrane protein